MKCWVRVTILKEISASLKFNPAEYIIEKKLLQQVKGGGLLFVSAPQKVPRARPCSRCCHPRSPSGASALLAPDYLRFSRDLVYLMAQPDMPLVGMVPLVPRH